MRDGALQHCEQGVMRCCGGLWERIKLNGLGGCVSVGKISDQALRIEVLDEDRASQRVAARNAAAARTAAAATSLHPGLLSSRPVRWSGIFVFARFQIGKHSLPAPDAAALPTVALASAAATLAATLAHAFATARASALPARRRGLLARNGAEGGGGGEGQLREAEGGDRLQLDRGGVQAGREQLQTRCELLRGRSGEWISGWEAREGDGDVADAGEGKLLQRRHLDERGRREHRAQPLA